MHIITRTNCLNNTCKIIDVVGKKEDAITSLYCLLDNVKEDQIVLKTQTENIVNIYKHGFVYGKTLMYRYQIIEYDVIKDKPLSTLTNKLKKE